MAFLNRLRGGDAPGPPAAPGAAVLTRTADFDEILTPKPGDWPTYHGRLDGNRFSRHAQITAANVPRLALQWSHSLRGFDNGVTPIVLDGIMYITGPNQVSALDARSGREIWRYSRPLTPGLEGDAARGVNRGVAVVGPRVFFVTDNAHLIGLNRVNGSLLWDVVMPENTRLPYGGTMAPLVVGNLVIAGVSGGDGGIRGFLAAYYVETGAQAWRFWTVPTRSDPAASTWVGPMNLEWAGGATWLTGTYDPQSETLYWPTGNPYPDTDGSLRGGDNLYTNCILALDVKTGKLRWYFQFTPHDLWDWDAQQPPLLVDAVFKGAPRQLLLQANRNGFFYVLDRATGKLLLAEPFVMSQTWASRIGADGRPVLLPSIVPDPAGTNVCPAIRGAANWPATSYSPATGLFYVVATENCGVYRSTQFGGGPEGRVAVDAGVAKPASASRWAPRRSRQPAAGVALRHRRRRLQPRRAGRRRHPGAAGDRDRHRPDRVGGAADRQLQQLHRHPGHRRRGGVLRPGERRVRRRRCSDRRPALVLRDAGELEGLVDDLRARRPPVRGGDLRRQRPGLRPARRHGAADHAVASRRRVRPTAASGRA